MQSLLMKKARRKGFTLTELIIVVAILAVIAAIITPMISNIVATSKTNADNENAAMLSNAIGRAIARGTLSSPPSGEITNKATLLTELSPEIRAIPTPKDTTKSFFMKETTGKIYCTVDATAAATAGGGVAADYTNVST